MFSPLNLSLLLQSLVDILCVSKFISHAHRKVALYFRYNIIYSISAGLGNTVLFECITKRDMDRVWKISLGTGSFSLFVLCDR